MLYFLPICLTSMTGSIRYLDNVREEAFDFLERIDADKDERDARDEGNGEQRPIDLGRAEQDRSRALDDAGHRVEREDLRIFTGDRGRINDRREEDKKLEEIGEHVAHVAILHVDRGEEESEP